ncbi:DoxX family protein [Nonlabens xiamenensis]|uniref:DoxX family protein n=1 Tax=Nonlabens xiamenensis TaxID=2341043 RepID=UPI001F0C5C53|nr:hypothetical protein [Nonlabens xiamenensis]
MKKWLLLYPFVALYSIAGLMHFLTPAVYLEVIPTAIPYPYFINWLAGGLELLVAVLVLFPASLWSRKGSEHVLYRYIPTYRRLGSWLCILMLAAFTWSHIYFIQQGHCAGEMCIPAWIGWVRLVLIHPLLIWWAYAVGRLE